MKTINLPIINSTFTKNGKTAIEVNNNNNPITIWVNGNAVGNPALTVNIKVNEVGDTFVATKDSQTLDTNNMPVFKAGDTVTRMKETYEFKSFGSNNGNTMAQAMEAAKVFGTSFTMFAAE